ncbi:MAG: hypothetical protein N2C14_25740 [Planctomycetales bacterium]
MDKSTENPYEPPQHLGDQINRGRTIGSVVYSILAIGVLGCVVAYVFLTRERFLETFAAWEMELPYFTRVLIHPAAPWVMAIGLAATIRKEFFIVNRDHLREWNHLTLAFAAMLLCFYLLAVFLPLLNLLQELS